MVQRIDLRVLVFTMVVAVPGVRSTRGSKRSKRRKLRMEVFPQSVSGSGAFDASYRDSGSVSQPTPETVAALRQWRLEEARRRAIAPFIILHDRTLMAIAAAEPRSTTELLKVPGIGPAKMAEYGEAIVHIVNSVPPSAAPDEPQSS